MFSAPCTKQNNHTDSPKIGLGVSTLKSTLMVIILAMAAVIVPNIALSGTASSSLRWEYANCWKLAEPGNELCACMCGDGTSQGITVNPVNLSAGRPEEKIADLVLPSPGPDIQITRSFVPEFVTNRPAGYHQDSWVWSHEYSLDLTDASGGVVSFYRQPDAFRKWLYNNNNQSYGREGAGPDDVVLTHTGDIYTFTWLSGATATFYDESYSRVEQRGHLQDYSDPYGNKVEYSYPSNSGLVSSIKYTNGTTNYRYLDYQYTLINSKSLLSRIVVHEGGDANGSIVAIVDYTYHDGSTTYPNQNGSQGDLLRVRTRIRSSADAAGSDPGSVTLSQESNVLYRYYNDTTNGGGGSGTIKMIFRDDAYKRLKYYADGQQNMTVFDVGDNIADDYSTYYFEYADPGAGSYTYGDVFGGDYYVVKEIARAACSSCGGGGNGVDGTTYTFTYWDQETNSGGDYDRNWTGIVGLVPAEDVALEGEVTTVNGNSIDHYYLNANNVAIHRRTTNGTDTAHFDTAYVLDALDRPTDITRPDGTVITRTYADYSNSGDGYNLLEQLDIQGNGSSPDTILKNTYDTTRKDILISRQIFPGLSDIDQLDISYTYWDAANNHKIKEVTVQLPAIPITENGDGTTRYETKYYINQDGNLEWRKYADGRVDYFEYDLDPGNASGTGGLSRIIIDVDTDNLPAGVPTPPSGFTNTNGTNVITTYTLDSAGRRRKMVEPDGRTTYWVYLDNETRTHVEYNSTTKKTLLPTHVVKTAIIGSGNKNTEEFDVDTNFEFGKDSTNGFPDGNDTTSITDSNKIFKRLNIYNAGGALTEVREWYDITNNLYTTFKYGYDKNGDVIRTVDGEGTITRYVRNYRRQLTHIYVGTDDTPTTGEWSPSNEAGTDLEPIKSYTFGSSTGYLTDEKDYTESDTDFRTTHYEYDPRGRLVKSYGEENVAFGWEYDNLNRVTKSIQYTSYSVSGSTYAPGNELSHRESSYNPVGDVWKEIEWISGSNLMAFGPQPNPLVPDETTTFNWYDGRRRLIKKQTDGRAATKYAYDSVGRIEKVFITDANGDTAGGTTSNSLADADDVIGDKVLEQTEFTYTDGQRYQTIIHWMRDHNFNGTGALGSNGARPSYTQYYYDSARRRTHQVEFGTNGSTETAPTYSTSPPAASDTVLVSITSYDANTGRAHRFTKPGGQITQYDFDDLGRVTYVIENENDWDPANLTTIGGGTNNDQDRVTKYTYNKNSDVTAITAYIDGNNSEITNYIYGSNKGTSSGTSRLASNSMLRAIIYPDSDDPTDLSGNGTDGIFDHFELAFNRQGETIWMKDPRTVTRSFEYDGQGRLTADTADSIPSGVDGAIRRINRTYNILGLTETVISRDGTSPTSTVVNEVARRYNGFGKLVDGYQDHDSAATTSSPVVQYAYADGSLGNRPTSVTYPQGTSFDFFYGTNTLNDHISRPRALKINGGKIVTYGYLGLNTPVIVNYKAEPSVYLDYTVAPTGGSTESETYKSFDRFGRTVLQNWIHEVTTSNLVDVVKIEHTYDRNSNRTSRDDQIDFIDNYDTVVTRDELYTYDGLNRLTNNQRGKLTSGSIAAGDRVQTEDWTLDALGNWDQYNYDGNGDEDFLDSTDLNDNRSHNDANELTDWDPYAADSGNQSVSPTFDGNGNLTDDKFAYKYTYDAWNRLVKAENQASTPVGFYGYDGLGRRIKHIFDTDGDGVAETNGDDIVYHEYYTANWERIEVRPDDSTTGASVFLYGLRSMDDIVLRMRDANQSGGLEERTYYLRDANGNVVMTIDDAAHGKERIFYRAYGEPECFPFGDLNGDYTTNASDLTIFDNIKAGGIYEKYNLLADVNLDGVVDATDRSYLVSNRNGWTGGVNVQSVDEVANDIGYAGYLFNDESQNYHVRNREYSPKLGRWLQRDQARYIDGMNLYQYLMGHPAGGRDPFGLQVAPPDPNKKDDPPEYHLYPYSDPPQLSPEFLKHLKDSPDYFKNPQIGPAPPAPRKFIAPPSPPGRTRRVVGIACEIGGAVIGATGGIISAPVAGPILICVGVGGVVGGIIIQNWPDLKGFFLGIELLGLMAG